ncbi:C10 family peptidase [Flavobacterium branchiicola]|uniref:C10 family peptidase n=1 Tax=Flavobacterium branchiicola TaxID=1114875 RepID=A0ABV9PLZ2_9FLAO|nr:C10 family peptidase [Flavobacterium branchiicola]MBS7256324.1 C10 family peptidase [Flavobacterium branchiicola]
MKNTPRKGCLFLLSLLFLFACSRENEMENSKSAQNENFVNLSTVKEIAGGIKFEPKSNSSQTSKSSTLPITKKIEKIDEVKNEYGLTVFYVINYVKGGYIILSSDNRAQPIIAFSEDNKFVLDDGKDKSYPLGLKSWVENAKRQISMIQNLNLKQEKREKLAWKEVKNIMIDAGMFEDKSVTNKRDIPNNTICYDRVVSQTKGPFLETTWWQYNGFNDSLDYMSCSDGTKHVYAGCVPIAMAQIMKFHQYPNNYNWSAMPLTSSSATTANFILDIHKAISSVYPGEPYYGCLDTGVNNSKDMSTVLKTKFGYTSAQTAKYDYQVVKANLDAGRPVLLSGFNKNDLSGHQWVCDGYSALQYTFDDCTGASALYFNMNWGWPEGRNNGYFAFNNFNPASTNYNEAIKMTYNIKP